MNIALPISVALTFLCALAPYEQPARNPEKKSPAETYKLASSRYDKGLDSFLRVLDAQRSLFAAQQGLVLVQLSKRANQVRLYEVLGGGSEPRPVGTLAQAPTTKK